MPENLDNDEVCSRRGSQPYGKEVLEKSIDLDYVLMNELGQFGRFQLNNFLLLIFPIFMYAYMTEYIFSAADIPHRCIILECGETIENAVYNTEELLAAYPEDARCQRFAPLGVNGSLQHCPGSLFDDKRLMDCEAFVYERENTVVFDFDLGCQNWLRVSAGTFSTAGTLLSLPITGFISDRWGRRVALVIDVFIGAVFGLIRAFSINYPMYLAMQFLQTTLVGGIYSSIFILVAELVGPKYRVIASATMSAMLAVGEVILGCVAWIVKSWRTFTIVLYVPYFIIICYYWLLSESVRWLLSKEKYDHAKVILEKMARVNKKQISEKSIQTLMKPAVTSVTSNQGSSLGLIRTILKSKVLTRRVCTTPIWWITTTFVFYGLSINSTSLSSTNMYLNYMLTGAIEIPGFFTATFALNRIGRKATMSAGYFLSAVCNITFAFIPNDLSTLSLLLYLMGKFGISVVLISLYLYTSELYPTQYRHTLLAFSSMIGRIGSIIAPLTPVFADYWSGLPSMLFGGMGVLSGLLVLTQPETLGTKMPDTLAEAEALGKPESKINYDI